MKIACVSDVHIGNHLRFGGPVESSLNERCRITIETLRRAVVCAVEMKCWQFMVLGDLFDKADPLPQMLAEVAKIVDDYSPTMKFTFLVGNHDQVSDRPGDHALAPLLSADVVQYPSWQRLKNWLWAVHMPFLVGSGDDVLKTKIPPHDETNMGALFFHYGIRDEETPWYLQHAQDSVSMDTVRELVFQYGIKFVAAGNWHQHRRWKLKGVDGSVANVVQCGTLCPTGFSDCGLDDVGFMTVWDYETGAVSPIQIPGPRFLKLEVGPDELQNEIAKARTGVKASPLDVLFLQVTTKTNELVSMREAAVKVKNKFESIRVIEVVVDRSDAERAARVASAYARDSSSIDEALHDYIDEYPIEAPGTKSGVESRIQRYRRVGS